ncbi:MAG TPA: glycosyltransferase family 4 protein [Chloroflexota bacterium]|nr:glycosyltransferase family 4 protein [Chloroflexota bacterium]
MRIGLVVPGFSAHDTDWCIPALRDFVAQLALEDEVWVVALRYPPGASSYSVFGATVQALGGGTKRRAPAALLWAEAFAALARTHRARPFDVLHAFWADEAGSIAAAAGRILGVPTVVSIAGGELVGFRDIKYGGQLTVGNRFKIDLALRLARAVTGGSRYVLELAAPRLADHPASRVRRLPLGIDVRRFTSAVRREFRPIDHRPRFVHAASLVPVKDQRALIRAAKRLEDEGLEFSLDIAGDGPLRGSLQTTIDALRLSASVRLVGPLPHDALPEFYHGATAMVLTSRHEAQCLAVLEAAAMGTPVVGTAVGVVPELAPSSGRMVGVGNDQTIAAEMAMLGSDSALVAELALAAEDTVDRSFRLDRCTDAFRELYRELAPRA